MRLTLFRCFLRSYRLSSGGKVPLLKQNGSIAAAMAIFLYLACLVYGYFSIWLFFYLERQLDFIWRRFSIGGYFISNLLYL